MAVAITLPVYRVNNTPYDFKSGPSYRRDWILGAAGVSAQEVGTPLNVVNGAFIYSAIKHSSLGDTVLYSNLTVAQVATLCNA
jgi:hypothetical protein